MKLFVSSHHTFHIVGNFSILLRMHPKLSLDRKLLDLTTYASEAFVLKDRTDISFALRKMVESVVNISRHDRSFSISM